MDAFTFKDPSDGNVRRHSAVSLDAQRRLVVEIHDIGGPFGEYESLETFSVEQTQRLTGCWAKT